MIVHSQPQQQQQQQQPQQPQNNYSNEQSMNVDSNEEGFKITVVLDKEAMGILQQTSAIHQESLINLGIKLFAKTNIYKEFLLRPDFKVMDNETDDLVEMTSVVETQISSSAPSSNPVVAQEQPSFASW